MKLFNLFNPILFKIIIYIWVNLGNLIGHTHKNHCLKIKIE